MPTYPTKGTSGWDDDLLAYLDARFEEAEEGGLSAADVAALAVPRTSRSAADQSRALRDSAYEPWNVQLESPTLSVVPRALIVGHSVVANPGFVDLMRTDLAALVPNAVLTSQGDAGFTSTQIRAKATNSVLAPATPQGLVIFMCMINDYFQNIASATTKANLLAMIADYRTANGSPSPSFLILGEWKISAHTTPAEPWDNYLKVAKEVADADPLVTFLDLSKRMGETIPDTYGLYNTTDHIHPIAKGSALLRRLVLAEILSSSPIRTLYTPHTSFGALTVPTAANNWGPYATNTGAAGPGLQVDSAGGYRRVSNGSALSEISYQFLGSPGRYSITLAHERGPDSGQYSLFIDGVQAGGSFKWDGYNATVDKVAQETVGYIINTPGLHTVTLKMLSQNASATGRIGRVNGLSITRYAAI